MKIKVVISIVWIKIKLIFMEKMVIVRRIVTTALSSMCVPACVEAWKEKVAFRTSVRVSVRESESRVW